MLNVICFGERNNKPEQAVLGCRTHTDVAQGMLNAVPGWSLDCASWHQLAQQAVNRPNHSGTLWSFPFWSVPQPENIIQRTCTHICLHSNAQKCCPGLPICQVYESCLLILDRTSWMADMAPTCKEYLNKALQKIIYLKNSLYNKNSRHN